MNTQVSCVEQHECLICDVLAILLNSLNHVCSWPLIWDWTSNFLIPAFAIHSLICVPQCLGPAGSKAGSQLAWMKLCGCSCGTESVAAGGEKSGVNIKLSEALTLSLSLREAWFCPSVRVSSAPCGDCGLKECCTGTCGWGICPDSRRGFLFETHWAWGQLPWLSSLVTEILYL